MKTLLDYRNEMLVTIRDHIIPFWLDNGIDEEYGGYLTSFDENGIYDGNGIKNIVTQSRMVWGLSYLLPFAKEEDKPKMKAAAHQGAEYLMNEFWDKEFGGFYWLLNRDGSIVDPAKLTYGEGFGVYALAQYAITYNSKKALEYAELGFDLIQKYAADNFRGGYYENIERSWQISPSGSYAGDRKSLDIHMHLLEAFTTLYQATGKEIHKRKLQECWYIIKTHMVNDEIGYGRNQFDLAFKSIPAINIMRTWNAERESNETIPTPTDTTSYGHNVELSWLGDLALTTIGERTDQDNDLLIKLLDFAMKYGYDHEYGGMYRDGLTSGKVLVTDKEWWQNWESLTGYLNGYCMTRNETYLNIYKDLWEFDKKYFMNYSVGESRQLLERTGKPLISNIGNPWKAIYHTGRAFAECITRLNALIDEE
ncbi:MAG: AGE family epimerase/isomerase [Sphaerochaetaceae bacterium]|nr:AGE family epimerase/isomerase [Sphaerochaetaceae bacterium]NLO60813.1 N-acylglucosamine 2-epimerase [Spirochaetales bacterium]MDD2405929.1 AGE family epimerase/isomerase [Sphaerochaetaceae bacterium]MDD3671445.1 AGE family epimerase/isomerase [Sphaerochaetaceae bacterium]MDD3997587.1 AGE family epimerase/isomerase [Sphaerochaetaceae bacterium]